MRRRFGRGRRRTEDDVQRSSIDAEHWFGRLREANVAGVQTLVPETSEDVPVDYAVLGRGQRTDGGEVLVGFSPTSGGDALLATLTHGLRAGGSASELLAIAPQWSGAARRRLALVTDLRVRLRGIEVPALGERQGGVEPEPSVTGHAFLAAHVASPLRSRDRELFRRALSGLEGLAAKHGGGVRACDGRIELVVMARRVASLGVSGTRMRLEIHAPDRSQIELTGEGLSTALDRLEGSVRKRLNDRKIRSGEEGLRGSLLGVLARAAEAETSRPWPLAVGDREVLDLIGTDTQGHPFVAAARERLTLPALGELLDATIGIRPLIALLLGPEARVGLEAPRLVLAAQAFDEAALAALSGLRCETWLFDVATRRGEGFMLERRELWAAPEAQPVPAAQREAATESQPGPEPDEAAERRPAARERRPAEGRARRPAEGRERRPAEARERRPAEGPAPEDGTSEDTGIEEISLFDLDDESRSSAGAETDSGRRRRGRGRGRRGRGRGDRDDRDAERGGEDDSGTDLEAGPRENRSRPSAEVVAAAADERIEDDEVVEADGDEVFTLTEDAPDLEVVEEEPAYDEDEESEDDGDPEEDRARRERERRRRARAVKPPEPEPEPPARAPRRRAAFVACADRSSILTTLVLARDLRLVEGVWIFPQSELMTFFRSIATDLREDTPINLLGFTASPPARDTIQAAALYRGRLDWYDHHDWPPEDLQALREALGEDRVHIVSGTDSSLATVLSERTRRSRFTDKLVELIAGRFTQHDYERWGRLWWHRIGELAERPGERRAEVDALLVGRPSDLAREAAGAASPPPPEDLAYVSGRDFRLVHFGGYTMVVVDVPAEFDLHLCARIARERYEAQISLAHRQGEELLVLGGDEGRGHRGLDLGAMTAHLAAKHEWIEGLPDDDHVARMRVRDLWRSEGRMDEVISEIAMGRSIVEG